MQSKLMDYVASYYKKESYLKTYSPLVFPIPSPELWPNASQHRLTPSFYTHKKARSPKKTRRKKYGKVQHSQTRSASNVHLKIKYKKRGLQGTTREPAKVNNHQHQPLDCI
ncbi:Uncharacterized protein Adt_14968 [Abeliophyllum distichum]|uniref:Uncharacterized protein n=1 Tax=Abeliophyllum distichum TaxID=126358 RepID=A0ABD1U151_9LAMI